VQESVVNRREADLIKRALLGHDDAFERLRRPVLKEAARLIHIRLQEHCEAANRDREAAELGWRRRNLRFGDSFRPNKARSVAVVVWELAGTRAAELRHDVSRLA
jgi:hypothetical protein